MAAAVVVAAMEGAGLTMLEILQLDASYQWDTCSSLEGALRRACGQDQWADSCHHQAAGCVLLQHSEASS